MEHHKKQLADALKNKSDKSLDEQLRRLHCYGGLEDPKKVRVELGYDFSGYSVVWLEWSEDKQEYVHWMTGGLIYFKRDNTWSVHT
jgi:hypothetical protein